MGTDSTNLHYWLNWRVLLCAIWVSSSMTAASILIWKYEGPDSEKEDAGTERRETFGTLYDDESWRTSLKTVHPAWLLLFRVLAFFVLLSLLVANFVVEGGDIFFYYTQWTSVLVTSYFGLGSLLSVYGCYKNLNRADGDKVHQRKLDAERSTCVAPKTEENANKSDQYTSTTSEDVNEHGTFRKSGFHEELNVQEIAGFWGYVFQIIYQTNAGAVMLTDCVFWLVIFPFRAIEDYDLDLLLIGMHSVNAVFLLGDTALNCLRFPWFRISYFLLWTSGYVIFQWVIHTCVSLWWPYPFLDLSAPHAPLWYFLVALFHIPCYAVFPLIIKLKHYLLSRRFPQSYSCRR